MRISLEALFNLRKGVYLCSPVCDIYHQVLNVEGSRPDHGGVQAVPGNKQSQKKSHQDANSHL